MDGVTAARREPFFFGVPLISRFCAADWGRIGDLLELTLRSVLAQTDPDFTLLLAGHDAPDCWRRLTRGDRRFRFLRAGWDPQAPTLANDDGGAKKAMILDEVRRAGGGLLMFLDADDLVDRGTVDAARATMRRGHVGAVVGSGIMLDFRTLCAISLPRPGVYEGPFVELCGSSTVARLEPDSPDPVRRDPHGALGSHHVWPRAAARAGIPLARLPVRGAYVVNTAQNHSETHGPFASWRRDLSAAVAREGAPIDEGMAAGFGLDLALLAAKARGGPAERAAEAGTAAGGPQELRTGKPRRELPMWRLAATALALTAVSFPAAGGCGAGGGDAGSHAAPDGLPDPERGAEIALRGRACGKADGGVALAAPAVLQGRVTTP